MRTCNPDSWNPGTPVEITPQAYEKQVLRWIRKSLGKPNNFEAKHQGMVSGRGGDYKIDVLVTFSALGGALFIVLVECKRCKRPVERDEILTLYGKVDAVGAHKGIMFSTAGFQKGALEYARAKGLGTALFMDGRSIYQTKAAPGYGPTPKAPAWVRLPRFAGELIELRDETVHCHRLEDQELDALAAWLGLGA
ncbi:MAG TPA: restriction endonuclease [Thermoanaerobaculia bacterium]|nr:restriction endonuclease [Thermoanaerobaculia bacterium]